MKRQSLLIALLLCSAFSLQAQNPELKALAEEDQRGRQDKPAKEITRSDQDRGRLVLELLAKGAAHTAEDKFNAALVLQHTSFRHCGKQLVSMSPDNYLLAHYLFKDEERCTEKRLHRGTPNFSSSVNFVFPEKERVRKALSKLLLIELKQCALITLNA